MNLGTQVQQPCGPHGSIAIGLCSRGEPVESAAILAELRTQVNDFGQIPITIRP